MPAILSLTETDIYKAVRHFVLSVLDSANVECVQGLDNLVPMPLKDYVVMTILYRNRMTTNIQQYDGMANTKAAMQPQQMAMQLDCFGERAEQNSQILATLWRDFVGCELMAPDCQPLHADDPKQMPFTNGESVYEKRWLITALLQYSPVVTTDQDHFDKAKIGKLIDVK